MLALRGYLGAERDLNELLGKSQRRYAYQIACDLRYGLSVDGGTHLPAGREGRWNVKYELCLLDHVS